MVSFWDYLISQHWLAILLIMARLRAKPNTVCKFYGETWESRQTWKAENWYFLKGWHGAGLSAAEDCVRPRRHGSSSAAHLTSTLPSLSWRAFEPFFENIDIPAMGRWNRSYRVWFDAESKNKCQSDQPMRAQLGSTPFVVKGTSSSFHPFFQDCVRGQHLCLAQVERSSSHTKTSEF